MAEPVVSQGLNPSGDEDNPVIVRHDSEVVGVQQPIVLLNDIQLASEIIVGENDDVVSVSSNASSFSREPTPVPEDFPEKEEVTNNYEVEEENSRKRSRSEYENEDEGQICPICLDNWTNSGEHRICCLKCGHLFGHSCIVRWLKSQTKKSCPSCKKRVVKSDIRFLYTKKLISVDNSELQEMQEKLDCVINERNNIQMELSRYICKEHALNQEINLLKSQLQAYKNNPLLFANSGSSSTNSSGAGTKMKLYMEKSLEVCPAATCRVFDVNPVLDLLMVNVKSPNAIFIGYGLRKICLSQYRTLAFLPLHTGLIRDVSFQNSNILSVGLDKQVKITDSLNNTCVNAFKQTQPIWSCCWDSSNTNHFYIGTQMGEVHKYDLRSREPVNILQVPGDFSPVVSVAHIPNNDADGSIQEGIISCKLNSLWFFEKTANDYIKHPLGIDGPFYGMKFNETSKQILVSSRPNRRNPNSRHTLATLTKVEEKIIANSIQTFDNPGMQSHLSRSCFVERDNEEFIAVHEDSNKIVSLWNTKNGSKAATVTAHDPVYDLNAVTNTDYNLLCGLTDKKLLFYRFS